MKGAIEPLPSTQYAVELTGAGKLRLNRGKPVCPPGPYGILARVEAVGICFSDLKLVRQFSSHPRKSAVVSGIAAEVLDEIASYVPGDKPTVPGHEAVCRIVAIGKKVSHHKVGERVLVQTDYRALRTAKSNAAFGYNFEGALQENVLMDERVVTEAATGERFLIPVGEDLSASAVCLVEPWACVEDSYANEERRGPKAGGRMLVVADAGHEVRGLAEALTLGRPARVTGVPGRKNEREALRGLGVPADFAQDTTAVPDEGFDDIVYFGARRVTVEALDAKLAPRGIMNVVTGGGRFGEPVSVGIGRVHYGMTRWTGTVGANAAESYVFIPESGEIRPGERILVVGAGGPMGQMHVIRSVASGISGITVTASDVDDGRLAALAAKVQRLAALRGVAVRFVNPGREAAAGSTYVALMAPSAALVAEAIRSGGEGCLVNVFAGIPAETWERIDLDRYIEKHMYMFGTSGSLVRDMKAVLAKVAGGRLDTNVSVEAISGMAGAIDGMRAVEKREYSGKIVVYPSLREMGLLPLSRMREVFPGVAERLSDRTWTKAAEDELLRVAGGSRSRR